MGITRTLALLLLVAALALGAAACSGDDDSGSGSGSKSKAAKADGGGKVDDGDSAKVAPVAAELDFVLAKIGSKDGGGVPIPGRAACAKSIPASCTGDLTCPAADDARKGDIELCAWLADRGRVALEPADKDARQVCTMIFGGAEIASVTGTIDGAPVSETFTRENGCAIARWDAVAPLWTGDIPAVADTAPDASGSRGAVGNPGAATSNAPQTGTRPQPEIMTDPPEAFDR